jgi:hypothetical protein
MAKIQICSTQALLIRRANSAMRRQGRSQRQSDSLGVRRKIFVLAFLVKNSYFYGVKISCTKVK